MQSHELKPIHRRKKGTRIGRGGKRGCYSGKGIKGQSSRAGRRMKPIIRELIKRYPKLRGYRFKGRNENWTDFILNLNVLNAKFNSGDRVNLETLVEKRLISRTKRERIKVKILGEGSISKKLIIEGCGVSADAKKKIEKAGGEIK
jgi:large subunit ribosomal protein L15